MGFGGISVWQLVIILIVFLLTLVVAPIRRHKEKQLDQRSLAAEGKEGGEDS